MTGAEKDVGPPMQCVLRGVGPARISGAQRVSSVPRIAAAPSSHHR